MINWYFFMVTASGAASAAGVQLRRAQERRRVRARLRDIPEATADVVEGTEVRLTGRVRPLDEELVAPLTGRRCVLYRVTGGSPLRATLPRWNAKLGVSGGAHESFAIVPFAIERGGGDRIIVDGPAADVDLPSAPRSLQQPELVRGYPLVHGLGRTRRRFDEVAVQPGDEITVIGWTLLDAAPEPAAHEHGFRDGGPMRLRVTGSRAHPLTITRR